MMAEMGTPIGSSIFGLMEGHCDAETVKRELGCAALETPSHGFPIQSIMPAGGFLSLPSHQGTPLPSTATLVKIVLRVMVSIALGLV